MADIRVIHGDMREQLQALLADGVRVQSIVTDPPYGLSFMGKAWDRADNVAFRPETWRLCYELLPPGGHMLCFGGTRTFHRLVCAIEDAGFTIRDCIFWIFGSGFPKSHNLNGDWQGWGTSLKPAAEFICVARRPLIGTVAANVLAHGTGALNIAACRVATDGEAFHSPQSDPAKRAGTVGADLGISGADIAKFQAAQRASIERTQELGRWPANVVHDGSAEVVKAFPDADGAVSNGRRQNGAMFDVGNQDQTPSYGDSGSAARFFYSAKADSDDRLGSKHPTVKPVDLMRWLVRLVTPPGGTCLDPFAGSGTTGMACMAEGFDCILVEREAEYVADIKARIAHVHGDDTPLFAVAADD